MNKMIPIAVCILLILFCVPAAASTTGAISVISSPNTADVYVDGVYVGVASDAFTNIPTGERNVRVVKAGYYEYTTMLHVSSSHTTSTTANLQKTHDLGGLVVDSTSIGASVYLNGVFAGNIHSSGRLQVAEIPAGEYTVLIELDGYKSHTVSNYMIPAGSITYLKNVQLNKITDGTKVPTASQTNQAGLAAFVLGSTPTGASVYLNGAFYGYTPITLENMNSGVYTILMTHSGYANWETQITINAGDTIQQNVVLTQMYAPAAPTKSPLSMPAIFVGLAFALCAVFLLRK